MPRKRILVVDNERAVAELVEVVLQGDGYEVETVHSGRAALERLAQTTYDLIVCDLHMPEVDGMDVYRAVQERLAAPPAMLFLSGFHDSAKYLPFVREAGVAVLAKPFELTGLRQTVRRLLEPSGPDPALA